MINNLKEDFVNALQTILPIVCIVIILSLFKSIYCIVLLFCAHEFFTLHLVQTVQSVQSVQTFVCSFGCE